MTDVLRLIGIENATNVISVLTFVVGALAVVTSLITEALKSIKKINAMPTKLVCYIVAIVVTVPATCAMLTYLKQPIEWFMVFASFLAAFVVAKVSMSGWDDVIEMIERMTKGEDKNT